MSCRLCKAKSHIPLSCDEYKKENGVSERRIIEEARTEALIRTCGKCKVRILKEDGCNKVICTKCYAVLCDYCGKDISKQLYNHFDGQGRAPPGVNTDEKSGKCPLYDESHKRKDQQVDKAEKEAMAKVRAEHPDLSEEDLKIKFSKGLQPSSNRHPGDHHHHHRHYGHGMREAAIAALYNREEGAALDAMFEGVGNMMDEYGGIAPHILQQAREQGRQAREQIRAAQAQAQQQQFQYHREALLRQQQAALLQQEALREDVRRQFEQAHRTGGLNQVAQNHRAHGARMTAMNNPIFPPFRNGLQAADFRKPEHNDQAFGNNARAQNVGIQGDVQARRQPNGIHRNVEERLNGLGGARNLDPAAQRREINDLRRRTAVELAAERTAERAAEWHRHSVHQRNHEPPLPMPGDFPRVQRRRNPVLAEAANPWVAGANDQAYL